jgi:hypothetical protein
MTILKETKEHRIKPSMVSGVVFFVKYSTSCYSPDQQGKIGIEKRGSPEEYYVSLHYLIKKVSL